MKKTLLIVSLLLIFLNGCSDEKSSKKSASVGMKCGAGKCGANMFDGNAALMKKKQNILRQMRKGDPRKDCVLQARTTKATYECVRDPKTKKMTLKCGNTSMKCGIGKCGGR